MKKRLSLILAAVIVLLSLAGCSAVSDIAENVAQAAREELENQIKANFEKNKIDILELKSSFGKLNDEGGEWQFFCAVLVQTEREDVLQRLTEGLSSMSASYSLQTGSQIQSSYLVHQSLSYDRTDFDGEKPFYTVCIYLPDLSIDLPDFTLPEFTLPS